MILKRIKPNGLTTGQFLYCMPETPHIIQPPLIWQWEDFAPDMPYLHEFLDMWQRKIDGILREVRVTHTWSDGREHFHVIRNATELQLQ